jgi:2-oxoglutarate ferredoxin oxidoreductase subunit beta
MRDLKLPFCAGCGLFSLSDTFLRAVYELGHRDLGKFCFASGIGCSSWIPSPYFLADSVHTLHGRSIPVATSIKPIRPDLNVVVLGFTEILIGVIIAFFGGGLAVCGLFMMSLMGLYDDRKWRGAF